MRRVQAMELAATVSADTSGFSVSFNEYLKLVSNERKGDPDEAALLNMFRWRQSLYSEVSGSVLQFSEASTLMAMGLFLRRTSES